MIYLYWYLASGVVFLALVYVANRLTKEKASNSSRELLEAVNPNRKKHSYRILDNVVAPILIAILVLAVWPLVVYINVKETRQTTGGTGIAKEREFAVECQHLQERLTVQEVERREVVTDPLKAVSELPFGHLNTAWKEFLNGYAEATELWSFTARWQTTWGQKELRSGYVIVENGVPGAYFLVVWKDLPDIVDVDGSAT